MRFSDGVVPASFMPKCLRTRGNALTIFVILKGELGKWKHSEIALQKNALSLLPLWHCEGSVRSVLADLEGVGLRGAAGASGKAQLALLVSCESS